MIVQFANIKILFTPVAYFKLKFYFVPGIFQAIKLEQKPIFFF